MRASDAVSAALTVGRQAAAVLEAPPADKATGYTDDEVAAHYAATDRLLAAFRRLDEALHDSCIDRLNMLNHARAMPRS